MCIMRPAATDEEEEEENLFAIYFCFIVCMVAIPYIQ